MSLSTIISSTLEYLFGLSKKKLVGIIDELRKRYKKLAAENADLKSEIAILKNAATQKQLEEVNNQSNKPSSKQAEWEKEASKAREKRKERCRK